MRHHPVSTMNGKSDGEVTHAHTHDGLSAGESAEFSIEYAWPDEEDYPLVTFTVDPRDQIQELIEDNNEVNDWIKGYDASASTSVPSPTNH